MAFVVEDGTGLPDANSYASVAEADAYHTDRGNAAWTGSNSVKQAALVRATDYVEQAYAGRWKGCALTEEQALSFPRDEAVVPAKLKQAVIQLALEAIATDLNPTQDRAVKREKVDVIEVEYMDNARNGKTRPAIDGLLSGLLSGSIYNRPLVRT
ncbi:DnaT-like ssDNA-binding protein [Micavibrio aeruginosavorus]|uniref:Putative DnaT-like domain-containing protein n=1 Tax=Micavibrio aeruginosavorus (strain ARL-13) TaxID=856793 RepID=G2KMW1_MICAA|nr:DnaT-like ssDNA-binding protein [Micavibrio aeruginosavorus]AEP08893.1 hypothetical protein MICA_556 [Micavibrio aeruginosavorus ARL-13]